PLLRARSPGGMDESSATVGWQRWVAEHAPKFLLYARQQARSEADAQDLVQEAVMEAMQRNGRDEPPPITLVFATIQRAAVDWARRSDRRSLREQAASEPLPVPWFDSSAEDRELKDLLEGALSKLPEIYSRVVTLKIWGGLTFAQIGEVLDIPANTAA